MKSVLGLLILLILGNSLGQESLPCGRDTSCVCSGYPVGDLVLDCNDCAGYYLCGDGVAYKKKCNPGQIFHGPSKACVWGQCPSSDETCKGPAPETSSTSTSTTTTTRQTPTSCNTTDVICNLPGQTLPNVEHCRLFYICLDDLCPAMGLCEMGLWFDRDLSVCVYPQNVKNCPANRD